MIIKMCKSEVNFKLRIYNKNPFVKLTSANFAAHKIVIFIVTFIFSLILENYV